MRCSFAAKAVLTAALVFLAGCSLVESVIEIEPRGVAARTTEATKGVRAKAAYAANNSGTARCDDVFGDGTTTCSDLARASGARYDQGRVEAPPKKPAGKKTEEEPGSGLSRLFKKWLMTGMRLNSWSNAR